MEGKRSVYRILIGKPEGKRSPGTLALGARVILKLIVKK
jgi:hypothetical protein